jgi:hypothetical protein
MGFLKQPSWTEAESRASECFFDENEVARTADATEGCFEKEQRRADERAARRRSRFFQTGGAASEDLAFSDLSQRCAARSAVPLRIFP